MKDRRESGKAAKNTHARNIRTMEEATRLLAELGVSRKDLPERCNKSYNSTVLDAINKGGFLYVSPRYLAWAKMLMTKVRASITVGVIRSLGNKAQDEAYKHLLKDDKLKELMTRKAKESNVDESAIEWVCSKE